MIVLKICYRYFHRFRSPYDNIHLREYIHVPFLVSSISRSLDRTETQRARIRRLSLARRTVVVLPYIRQEAVTSR